MREAKGKEVEEAAIDCKNNNPKNSHLAIFAESCERNSC